METTQRLGIGNVTDHRLCMATGNWRMNGEENSIRLHTMFHFFRLTCNDAPDVRSVSIVLILIVSAIRSFLLQDIARHPDIRLSRFGTRFKLSS